MAGEGEPKRNLRQEIGGFIVESRIGRGAQRLGSQIRAHIPLVNRAKPMQALEKDLGAPLGEEVELTLWELALKDLPDEFWQKQLNELPGTPKPEDPTKSVN